MEDHEVSDFISRKVEEVREKVGDGKALVAVSGGVDSTVSAVIAEKALGERLVCVFIDTNFMRLGEAEQVKRSLSEEPLGLEVRVLNERERFMEALNGLSDAEEKRKAFRDCFYSVLSEVAQEEGCGFLVQGTTKADVDETHSGVKTQHNVLDQVDVGKYGWTVLEPIRGLYKQEVRQVARALGVPIAISERQPFPGPGLSIRVVGAISPEKLEVAKKANFIAEEVLAASSASQYFAAVFSGAFHKELKVVARDAANILGVPEGRVKASLLQEKATGMVKGSRVYGSVLVLTVLDESGRISYPGGEQLNKVAEYVFENYPEATRLLVTVGQHLEEGFLVALRAVNTVDFLSATAVDLPRLLLEEVASKIFDQCPEVGMVCYDYTDKPPATIEYE